MRGYLSGFNSLRTRPNVPPQIDLPQRRQCIKCGAVLRRSNPDILCGPCWGVVDIPEWAETIINSDDNIFTVQTIANHVARANGYERPETTERNEYILERYEAGETETMLADSFGIRPSTIRAIVGNGRKRREAS